MAVPSRPYDALYDKIYTVSSATDHYREQSRAGGFGVERCPEFSNFYSNLPHYPSTTFRLKNTDNVPQFISREHLVEHPTMQERAARSQMATVNGPARHKYSQRPHLSGNVPLVVVKAPRPVPATVRLEPLSHPVMEPTRTFGTQSDFRESDAQTDPYSPDFIIPANPTLKQQMLSAEHHCEGPEIAHLTDLRFGAGLPPGAIEVERIDRLRAKRKFEASLPPLSDIALLPMRQRMMEAWEKQEWVEREAEIKLIQDERLSLLEQAIMARELELEEGHAERVQATTNRLLAGKMDVFTTIQRSRIKAMRHFTDARKYVNENRFTKKESIIEKYANPGSRAYAPPQREGIFPDSKPKGKEIETEHFGPTNYAGIAALEAFLPKHLLSMKVKAPQKPTKLDFSQRRELAMRTHLDHIATLLAEARANGREVGAGPETATKTAKKKKVVVRNAARPETPIQPPPSNEDALHKAAMLLQRLVRGRAIQNDMFEGCTFRSELITELLQPVRTDITAAAVHSESECHAARLLGPAIREILQILSMDSSSDRQAALDGLGLKRQELEALPDEVPAASTLTVATASKDEVMASIKIQAGFRGLKARKRVAVMKAEGAAVRKNIAAGKGIRDLSEFQDEDVKRITKLQANVRGHLDRKKVKALKENNAKTAPATPEPATAPQPTDPAEPAAQQSAEADESVVVSSPIVIVPTGAEDTQVHVAEAPVSDAVEEVGVVVSSETAETEVHAALVESSPVEAADEVPPSSAADEVSAPPEPVPSEGGAVAQETRPLEGDSAQDAGNAAADDALPAAAESPADAPAQEDPEVPALDDTAPTVASKSAASAEPQPAVDTPEEANVPISGTDAESDASAIANEPVHTMDPSGGHAAEELTGKPGEGDKESRDDAASAVIAPVDATSAGDIPTPEADGSAVNAVVQEDGAASVVAPADETGTAVDMPDETFDPTMEDAPEPASTESIKAAVDTSAEGDESPEADITRDEAPSEAPVQDTAGAESPPVSDVDP